MDEMAATMMAPVKPGVKISPPNGPVIETEHLILRRWRESDIGATVEGEGELLGHITDLWVTRREVWTAQPKP